MIEENEDNIEEVRGLHLPELYEDASSYKRPATPLLSGRCSVEGSKLAGSTQTLDHFHEENYSTDTSSKLPESDTESILEELTLTSDYK
jgi:hypothetical protein